MRINLSAFWAVALLIQVGPSGGPQVRSILPYIWNLLSPLTLTAMWSEGLKEVSRAHVSSVATGKEGHHLHGTARSSRVRAAAAENRGLHFAKEWPVLTGAQDCCRERGWCVPPPAGPTPMLVVGMRGQRVEGSVGGEERGTCNTFSSQHGPAWISCKFWCENCTVNLNLDYNHKTEVGLQVFLA